MTGSNTSEQRHLGVVVFEDFELLDVFGPLEMFGMLPALFRPMLVAEKSGAIASAQGPRVVAERSFDDCERVDILLVPGGQGTRREVRNVRLLEWLRECAGTAEYITSVCTGSALLAAAGLLDGRRATSNKLAFDWVRGHGTGVQWVTHARWVEDGRTITSSGVCAGMDMSLALIAKLAGDEAARHAAVRAEYEWHHDASSDPFAALAGIECPARP